MIFDAGQTERLVRMSDSAYCRRCSSDARISAGRMNTSLICQENRENCSQCLSGLKGAASFEVRREQALYDKKFKIERGSLSQTCGRTS